MITLKQAISLLSLKDSDHVFLCKSRHEFMADSISVGEIRKKMVMKMVTVKKIYPDHFIFDNEISWEFIVG